MESVEAISLQKNITFVNWTRFKAQELDHNGDIEIQASCYLQERVPTPINGIDKVEVIQNSKLLPPTGISDWEEGKIICPESHGLKIHSNLDHPIQLYRNYQLVEPQPDGTLNIGENCDKGNYWAYMRYLPKSHYDFPHERDHEDPMGHYALYDFCY